MKRAANQYPASRPLWVGVDGDVPTESERPRATRRRAPSRFRLAPGRAGEAPALLEVEAPATVGVPAVREAGVRGADRHRAILARGQGVEKVRNLPLVRLEGMHRRLVARPTRPRYERGDEPNNLRGQNTCKAQPKGVLHRHPPGNIIAPPELAGLPRSPMPTEPKTYNLALRRVLVSRAAPKQAHHMVFSRNDDEFVIEVGYIDIVEMKTATDEADGGEPGAAVAVPFYVTDRFCLNRDSWMRVKKSFLEFDDRLPGEEAPTP